MFSRAGDSWTGESGQIGRETIERFGGDLTQKAFYVCGPAPMMRAVIGALRQLGVPRSRIHYEYFSL